LKFSQGILENPLHITRHDRKFQLLALSWLRFGLGEISQSVSSSIPYSKGLQPLRIIELLYPVGGSISTGSSYQKDVFMAPRSSFRIVTDDVRAIRVLREKKRLSVNKAAPVVGTNKSTLTALENGRINLSRQWIEKILKGYRTSWEEFEHLKQQRLSSKETLLEEIRNEAAKLSYEKLQTIRQLLIGFQ
jgi:DNA-binding XRE family transcriptional regulator